MNHLITVFLLGFFLPAIYAQTTSLNNGTCTNQECCRLRANPNPTTGDGYWDFAGQCLTGALHCVDSTGCLLCHNGNITVNLFNRPICGAGAIAPLTPCADQACCTSRVSPNTITGYGYLEFTQSCLSGGNNCVDGSGCLDCFNPSTGATNVLNRPTCSAAALASFSNIATLSQTTQLPLTTATTQLPITSETVVQTTAIPTSETVVQTTAIPTSETVVQTTAIPTSETAVQTTQVISTSQTAVLTTAIPTSQTVVQTTAIPTSQTVVQTTAIPTSETVVLTTETLLPTSQVTVQTVPLTSQTPPTTQFVFTNQGGTFIAATSQQQQSMAIAIVPAIALVLATAAFIL